MAKIQKQADAKVTGVYVTLKEKSHIARKKHKNGKKRKRPSGELDMETLQYRRPA